MLKRSLYGVVLASSQMLQPAYAQEGETAAIIEEAINNFVAETSIPNQEIREATIDLAVPTSPAFAVLGLAPDNIIQPTSPRELALSLLNGAGPNGSFQTGLAVDVAPYLLFAGNEISLQQYRESQAIQLAARTQVSFATTKGTDDDDEALRFAVGLRLTLFDRGNPRAEVVRPNFRELPRDDWNLLECFTDAIEPVHQRANQLLIELAPAAAAGRGAEAEAVLNERLPPLEADAREVFAEKGPGCRTEARLRNWNASSWSVGVAPTWTSPAGGLDDLEWSGAALWTSLAYGFEELPVLSDTAQVILHGRYRTEQLFPDPDVEDRFFEQDTLVLGVQTRIAGFNLPLGSERDQPGELRPATLGGPDLNFVLTLSYIEEDREDRDDEELFRYSAGVEYQLTGDVYLTVTIGSETGREDDEDQAFVLGALKFGFSNEPTLGLAQAD